MESDYKEFIESKRLSDPATGLAILPTLTDSLYPFQRDIDGWALRRGRAAVFADCGMGKTAMQLEWARHVCDSTGGAVLVLAPLAVAQQTCREGMKFGITVSYARKQADASETGITITNYEMVEHFDAAAFAGVVLDESSILKSHTGKYRETLVAMFAETPFRLCCTATPAPNDFMELGNHAEFLGVMTRVEMLATFFVHDGGDTAKWRLKGHAESEFWKWLCTWAVMIRKPSDLGYEDGAFILPPLDIHDHVVRGVVTDGDLIPMQASTLQERQSARRSTVEKRCEVVADMVNASDECWLVWCDLNSESTTLAKLIPDAVQVTGSDPVETKTARMEAFTRGEIRVLVTKPSIAGFGMNWQHCANMAFVGLSDSYEKWYQAVRRCWRFGQARTVHAHVVTAETEGAVVANIRRKEDDAERMAMEMVKHMADLSSSEIRGTSRRSEEYIEDVERGANWTAYRGDCVETVKRLADGSVGFSVFSPPFASLYTYSNSDRDMGNCADDAEFMAHFRFLVAELFRVTKPGRLCSFHCMNMPAMKERDGYIGLKDFRGELIKVFQSFGWIFHAEACIWKDPLIEATRTKALGLMHKQLTKDSSMCRQGIPDYLITMRKPGDNAEFIYHEEGLSHWAGSDAPTAGNLSHERWRRYASPVWMDIRQTNTMNGRAARDQQDERHICPLQLDVIERAVFLWSNPGDVVLSPFMGIGSEGVVASKMGRRFVGVELKESYYRQAVANLRDAEMHGSEQDLFSLAEMMDDSE
jgi:superfamily II DNA or RNA helicase